MPAVYLPAQFASQDRALALALLAEQPLAQLITLDAAGEPFVSHLPLVAQERGDGLVLLGHLARANPQVAQLRQQGRALVSVLGPHAYLSPSVYPDLARVPTWNYLALHARVSVEVVDEALAKDRLLKALIARVEPPYAEQWLAMEPGLAERMLGAIVGFEFHVTELDLKLKLNQHRREAHATTHARYAAGSDHERALARWMERLGLAPAGDGA